MRAPLARAPAVLAMIAMIAMALAIATTALPAGATFREVRTATSTVATATLAPPTGYGGTGAPCSPVTGGGFTVTWTRSTSTYVTGYRVQVTVNGTPNAPVDLGPTATTYSMTVPAPPVLGSRSYVITVSSRYLNWSATTAGLVYTC